jgi:hypothetical protein
MLARGPTDVVELGIRHAPSMDARREWRAVSGVRSSDGLDCAVMRAAVLRQATVIV